MIKGWIESSFLDWPGKIASVIFLPGCNFRCPFCHNHRLVQEPDSLDDIPLSTVLTWVGDRKEWIDGLVVSGGEPTVHPGLFDIMAALKGHALAVKLDTNGSRPDILRRLIMEGLVDHVAMDLKAPLEEAAYRRLAGIAVDVGAVRKSISLIISSGLPHTFRSTVVPGLLSEYDLLKMGRELAGSSGLVLQSFKPEDALDPDLRSRRPLPEEEMTRLSRLVNELIKGGTPETGSSL